MRHMGLNATQVEVLRHVYSGERTVSRVAEMVGRSTPWTSECITRLETMDLVRKRKEGLAVHVAPAEGDLAGSLEALLTEASLLDLTRVLSKAALAILPVLLGRGATVGEVELRTGLSPLTIRKHIREWRSLGIVLREGGGPAYRLDPGRRELVAFIIQYSRWYNLHHLKGLVPDGVILWQWRDEFLFSTGRKGRWPGFLEAGPTRLEELDFDIVHTREYYLHDRGTDRVSVEEALVQSMLVDPKNPRLARFLRDGLNRGKVDPGSILSYGSKYGIASTVEGLVS